MVRDGETPVARRGERWEDVDRREGACERPAEEARDRGEVPAEGVRVRDQARQCRQEITAAGERRRRRGTRHRVRGPPVRRLVSLTADTRVRLPPTKRSAREV